MQKMIIKITLVYSKRFFHGFLPNKNNKFQTLAIDIITWISSPKRRQNSVFLLTKFNDQLLPVSSSSSLISSNSLASLSFSSSLNSSNASSSFSGSSSFSPSNLSEEVSKSSSFRSSTSWAILGGEGKEAKTTDYRWKSTNAGFHLNTTRPVIEWRESQLFLGDLELLSYPRSWELYWR